MLGIAEIDRTQVAVVGGKGAGLGELSRVEGVNVPPGYCVTTDAFQRFMAEVPSTDARLERLSQLDPDDREAIGSLGAELRATIEQAAVPDELAAAIVRPLTRWGDQAAYAVRSSATAEDQPTASFAGQHDTYLNVSGPAGVLQHVQRCWGSLFTERAIAYRVRHGIDHRGVHMAVVVQQMVDAQASGVMFTADPVTGHRNVVSVEAVVGLGDALVSGRVNPDVYAVRGDEVESTAAQPKPVLTAPQVLRLAMLGRHIEEHFGRPQDIEWCVADDEFQIVQSRPITTLFPLPEVVDDDFRVYVSVGHQQMMTDAMQPLGLSLWQATTPRPMFVAGGRLFVDVARELASPTARAALVNGFVRSDPLIGTALQAIVERGEVPPGPTGDEPARPPAGTQPGSIETDPAVVADLIETARDSLAALEHRIRTVSGPALVEMILADLDELRRNVLGPRNLQAIMTSMDATWWLNEHLERWLGEKNVADTLAQSVPDNVTAQMGLALLDVADVIRLHPAVVTFLDSVEDDDFLADLPDVEGGQAATDAILAFLDTYGMRCVGEIDVTRPRWRERPTALLPAILANVRNVEPGAATRRFEHGRQQAEDRARDLVERLRQLPDGEAKAAETRRMIDRLRTFAGYREYPKYHLVSRYFVYRQALLAEADRLVEGRVLHRREDVYHLTLDELREVARSGRVDEALLRARAEDFVAHQALTPPRVFTSHGEVVTGTYQRDDVPAGALIGLPVSAGTVEGRARIVLDLAAADLEAGDILVTPYTDPSWTPVFLSISGLVTEVGGQMTHGAVIAREYGLPAVVGVEGATRLIRDGQRIRVHGTDGYVELLP
ncbi:MAG TPA: rifamycin-inactivating phosphotransferase [Egicoccus sp.]|nr:rifamycin-inactivating phosphotransferase [Egicoccus sp.]HSK24651.1 rifamycin-inactivating phosphotransferase [Egicoccus sp.]